MKKEQIYSGAEFSDALLRRNISLAQLARSAGLKASTISKWGQHGVPIKHQDVIKAVLDKGEETVHGAHHQDMFPDTIKGQL